MNNISFRYSGSKQHLVKYINSIIPKEEDWFYVESFLGSGAIFYNLENQFRWNYLTDIDKNIIRMHNCFKKYSYAQYKSVLDFVLDNFGDIKTDKEAYYKLRDCYNKSEWRDKDLVLLMLSNSCINSMLRFGPNGMNQSWGNRHHIIPEDCWDNMKSRLEKATLKNLDYSSTFNMINQNNKLSWFVFLDPPYVDRFMVYENKFNRIDYLKSLISITCDCKNIKVVYSDIDNEESDMLLHYGFNKINSKILRNSAPYSKKELTKREVLYLYNIES